MLSNRSVCPFLSSCNQKTKQMFTCPAFGRNWRSPTVVYPCTRLFFLFTSVFLTISWCWCNDKVLLFITTIQACPRCWKRCSVTHLLHHLNTCTTRAHPLALMHSGKAGGAYNHVHLRIKHEPEIVGFLLWNKIGEVLMWVLCEADLVAVWEQACLTNTPRPASVNLNPLR